MPASECKLQNKKTTQTAPCLRSNNLHHCSPLNKRAGHVKFSGDAIFHHWNVFRFSLGRITITQENSHFVPWMPLSVEAASSYPLAPKTIHFACHVCAKDPRQPSSLAYHGTREYQGYSPWWVGMGDNRGTDIVTWLGTKRNCCRNHNLRWIIKN